MAVTTRLALAPICLGALLCAAPAVADALANYQIRVERVAMRTAPPGDAEQMLARIANQPFDADMLALERALVDHSFQAPGGIGTPPLGFGGAMSTLDQEPGVAAPGNGIVTSP